MRKLIFNINIFLLIITFLFLSCDSFGISERENKYDVINIFDGDTFTVDDEFNSHIRLLGINTPELLNEHGPGEPFSNEAYELTRKLVNGKKVRLEFEEEKYDQYGRILAYVFVDDLFLNYELLKNGFARSFFIGNKLKYSKKLIEAENQAKKEKRGIWGNPESFYYPKSNNEFLIKPLNSTRYIDQKVALRGKVTEKIENKKVIILKIENDLDIVIFKDNLDNFDHFNLDPRSDYTGKLVEVLGRVRMYKGRPQISVHHPISLRILK